MKDNVLNLPIVKVSAVAGLLAFVFTVLYNILLFVLKVGVFDGLYNVSFFVNLIFTGLAIYHFRINMNFGELRFWQGMVITFIIVLISSLLVALFMLLYLGVIAPEFLEFSKQIKVNELVASKEMYLKDITEEGFNGIITIFKETAASQVAFSKILLNLFVSLIYGTILSIIFRT